MLEITIVGEQKEVIAVIVVDSKKGAPFISENVILANGYDVEFRKIGKIAVSNSATITLDVSIPEPIPEPMTIDRVAEMISDSINRQHMMQQ